MKNSDCFLPPERVRQLLKAEPGCLLLDLRRPEEYRQRHLPGAVWAPPGGVACLVQQRGTPKAALMILCCRTGRESRAAAAELRALGWARAYSMGSLSGWRWGVVWGVTDRGDDPAAGRPPPRFHAR